MFEVPVYEVVGVFSTKKGSFVYELVTISVDKDGNRRTLKAFLKDRQASVSDHVTVHFNQSGFCEGLNVLKK